jgi:hypothetical protein
VGWPRRSIRTSVSLGLTASELELGLGTLFVGGLLVAVGSRRRLLRGSGAGDQRIGETRTPTAIGDADETEAGRSVLTTIGRVTLFRSCRFLGSDLIFTSIRARKLRGKKR